MTSNQINYWKVRNDKIHNEEVRRETHRYNVVQEELKRIDQQLQADLNAINARYKEKQYQLDKHDMEFQHRMSEIRSKQAARQLEIDAGRVQATFQQNYINSLAQQETQRSNKAREELQRQSISLDRAMLPYQQTQLTSQSNLNRAHTSLTSAQTKTEGKKPANVQSQTFSNYANPIINGLNGVLKSVMPFVLAR